MKQLIVFLWLALIFTGCDQHEDNRVYVDTGRVINFSGSDYCGIIIELDNGQRIQPHLYPEGFEFIQGQRLLVQYAELPDIASTCSKGTVCEILDLEVLSCGAPVTEADMNDNDIFENDPLNILEAKVEGDCLYMLVSYSGGCRDHDFILTKVENEPADEKTAVLELRHNANNDLCEAALSRELQFSLISLTEAGYTKIRIKALLENGEIYSAFFDLNP